MKKRKDGRYVKKVDGKYFYGASEREVYKKLLEYTEKKEKGATFKEAAEDWWRDAYDGFASQTLRGYVPAYKRALAELGDMYLSEITPRHIQAIFKAMSKGGLSRKTISNQRIIYNQIFDSAVVNGYIQYNPCASVKLPPSKKSTVIKPATPEEEQKIIASSNPWIFPVFALLTGLRKQEILALQWQDVDFEANVISVTKAVEHIGKRPNIKSTKTESGNRNVPLLDALRERLLPKLGSPQSYIFSDDGGKTPLSEHRFERLYKDYCADVGIGCSSRQLRHSFATVAVEEDVQPKDLQNALGHADISTTMNVYAAARAKSVMKVASKLNVRYSKKSDQ